MYLYLLLLQLQAPPSRKSLLLSVIGSMCPLIIVLAQAEQCWTEGQYECVCSHVSMCRVFVCVLAMGVWLNHLKGWMRRSKRKFHFHKIYLYFKRSK